MARSRSRSAPFLLGTYVSVLRRVLPTSLIGTFFWIRVARKLTCISYDLYQPQSSREGPESRLLL